MSDNNKMKSRRPRIKEDIAETVSIRIRRSHLEGFSALKSGEGLGKFVGDLIEAHFSEKAKSRNRENQYCLSEADFALVIGNHIDGFQSRACFFNWINGDIPVDFPLVDSAICSSS